MDRVFKSGASATPPVPFASPSVGYPISGDPGTGTPATKPGGYWYYMITEELRGLITAAGLTPDPANLNQVALAVQELIRQAAGDYKASVRVATTANIAALAGGAPNTLDGVTLVAGDRILVKDQTTGSQNGLYVVTTLGTGANGTWSRAGDADAAGELSSGAVVAVEAGTVNVDSLWMLTTDGTITIGTTALVFARKDGATAIASTAEAQAGTENTKTVTPLRLREALNAAGNAPVYACRAWVNFNGTGTVAIRASGNVSSITDHATGEFSVNLTTALPDINFSFVGTASHPTNGQNLYAVTELESRARTTTSVSFNVNQENVGLTDSAFISINLTR